MDNMKNFFYSNWAYLIWGAVYMFLTWIVFCFSVTQLEAIVLTIVIYAVSIGIALSPAGEIFLRFSLGARKPATREEIDYLAPIFEEVYQSALEENSSLNKDIQVYIDNSMIPNAYAVGRKTVAVTMGALQTFSQDELKGVLAHELGHISHGDTKTLLLNNIGNGFFGILIFFTNIGIRIFQFLIAVLSRYWWINIIFNILVWIANLYILVFQLIGDLILSLNSRQSEYFADKFAYQIGYG